MLYLQYQFADSATVLFISRTQNKNQCLPLSDIYCWIVAAMAVAVRPAAWPRQQRCPADSGVPRSSQVVGVWNTHSVTWPSAAFFANLTKLLGPPARPLAVRRARGSGCTPFAPLLYRATWLSARRSAIPSNTIALVSLSFAAQRWSVAAVSVLDAPLLRCPRLHRQPGLPSFWRRVSRRRQRHHPQLATARVLCPDYPTQTSRLPLRLFQSMEHTCYC